MDQKIRTLSKYIAILLDICVMLVAYAIANLLRFSHVRIHIMTDADYAVFFWFVIIAYIAVQLFFRTNIDFLTRDKAREAFLVLKQYVIVFACVMTFFYVMKLGSNFSRLHMGYFFVISIIGTYIGHLLLKEILRRKYMTTYAEKLVLISDSLHAGDVLKELRKINYLNVEYITLIDKNMTGQDIDGVPVVADMDSMEDVIKNIPVDGAFIHISKADEDIKKIMEWLHPMGIKIHLDIQEYGYEFGKKQFGYMGIYGVLTYANYEYVIRDVVIKRIMDILGGILLFIAMCITLPFVAAGIALQSPGPIFFKQTRIGRNGRRFQIYKFRSMYMDAEERKAELMAKNEMGSDYMFKIKDDPRIFPVGRIIRKLSIDELPQAINIIKGDMSLVGTRPPTESEFEMYNPYHRRRVSIKPGLTGLWQVSGRSSITDFDEIVKLDCEYIDNWNLRLDIKIIMKTVWVVLFSKGAE
ncbi:MAG TPA: hypothetical protein DCZ23_07830 [Lachnospiraceae bacterium]|nr:hypothetical protein [Lachnospiraceae bacterium]